MFKLGVLVNPCAGVGGPAALKGSDGVFQKATDVGVMPRVQERMTEALRSLRETLALHVSLRHPLLSVVTLPGVMGENSVKAAGLDDVVAGTSVVEQALSSPTTPEDTHAGVIALLGQHVDLLLFAGGDGTARDVVKALGDQQGLSTKQLVLGVPAGVKMHSGVFAVTPVAAGSLVANILTGDVVSVADREVRDIDEARLRAGELNTCFYGELRVPEEGRYLQNVKCGGKETELSVLDEIAQGLIDEWQDDTLYVVGPGSTTEALMNALGLENTLLGVDAVFRQECVINDADEVSLFELVQQYESVNVLVSPIGGQGHLLGRGNQQISPRIIGVVGVDNFIVLSTERKLQTLDGRPLLVDTGDTQLDQQFAGLISVRVGYEENVLYRVGYGSE